MILGSYSRCGVKSQTARELGINRATVTWHIEHQSAAETFDDWALKHTHWLQLEIASLKEDARWLPIELRALTALRAYLGWRD